jgi:hypothetical protein
VSPLYSYILTRHGLPSSQLIKLEAVMSPKHFSDLHPTGAVVAGPPMAPPFSLPLEAIMKYVPEDLNCILLGTSKTLKFEVERSGAG